MILSPKELRLTDKFSYENISPTVKITSKTFKGHTFESSWIQQC